MADSTAVNTGIALGGSLGKLTQKELLYLVRRLCEIAAEQRNDAGFRGGFRPGNIFISGNNITVGPADKAGEDGWTKDMLEYMAPEVFWNGKKTAKADVYSIGLILFVGLNCGNVPFVPMADYNPTPEIRANALRTRMNGEPVVLPASVDPKLREICEKAVAFDADERFDDTNEFLEALKSFSYAEGFASEKKAAEKPAVRTAPAKAPEKTAAAPAPEKKQPAPSEEPVAVKAAGKRPTKYQKKALRTKTVTLIVVVLLLCGVAAASELLDPASVDIGEWFKPAPSAEPTAVPTVKPTVEPTVEPTVAPVETAEPTVEPTQTPSKPVYEIITEDISWDKAEMKCREMGGHLATIRSEDDLNDICALLNGTDVKYAWIGCYRNNNGVLTWVDGAEVNFYAWASGEPSETDSYDGANEDYLMLVRQDDGSWLYNDNRMDPFISYAKYYSGRTAFVCSHG